MTLVLLDHPWPLREALKLDCGLKRFNDWIRTRPGFEPAPFFDRAEYDATLNEMYHGGSYSAFFARFAYDYVKREAGGPTATPLDAPNDLPISWRQALRTAMSDPEDWRRPQIVALEERGGSWQPHLNELRIRLDDTGQVDMRVFAIAEQYEQHPFASSDIDPWNLRHFDPNPLGHRNPCRLPRPPAVDISSPARIDETLNTAREKGWRVGNRYWFIPPADWRATNVPVVQWRNGRAFRQQQGPQYHAPRPIDYGGRVWVWDYDETQWDVQEGASYYRISERGTLLPRSPLS